MTFKPSLLTQKLKKKPIIWTISGADCSGGAGIAADIKTGHGLNVEVCHLITANTVQNSVELSAVNAIKVQVLAQQTQALRFDKPPAVIKIGLLVNSTQVNWLVATLLILKQQLPDLLVVYDPVGQASVGGRLSSLTANALAPLMPLIDVITPNLIEAKQLGSLSPKSTYKVEVLAANILQLGCKAVIIKGGHTDSENTEAAEKNNAAKTHCIDICLQSLSSSVLLSLKSPKINTNYSHGGGCSFASALASFLAHDYLLRDAFTLTKAFINQGLSLCADIPNGNNEGESQGEGKSQDHPDVNNSSMNYANNENYYGAFQPGSWPTKLRYFPSVISPLNQQVQLSPNFPSLGLTVSEKLGLYPVIDSLSWLECLLPLNLNIIQLRIKSENTAELGLLIEKAVTMASDYHCRLFINDHWQLAIKYGAYGVHIGQEDLNSADLKAIAKSGLRLGISTHGCYEFLLAKQLQPSYLAIGAIFATNTKDMTGQIQGLTNLRQILALADNIPVVAIGGINQQRLEQVWRTGVSAVAVVTAITEAEQPVSATQTMQALLG
ncbi:thiamine phosphate synthase [Colwellia sp. MB3u-70]|uniref:thiamine phosphate synthase n=1 Tax=unclassified Colwellia TaxID=196834 RepID=UPI0015F5BC87|nr:MULTISPECIES: thiamine phosphate synthase [unclassified Colwellia]MBA6291980.1 thiamine phosphate synthase [Colwellia sp. MB3u-8]MBA6308624.1 thiamine phosphate synthase [Colwellia sp. MB3u-70]